MKRTREKNGTPRKKESLSHKKLIGRPRFSGQPRARSARKANEAQRRNARRAPDAPPCAAEPPPSRDKPKRKTSDGGRGDHVRSGPKGGKERRTKISQPAFRPHQAYRAQPEIRAERGFPWGATTTPPKG